MRSLRSLFPSLPVLKGQDGDASTAPWSSRTRTREQALVEKLLSELMPADLAREIVVWVRRTAPSPAGLARRDQAGLELRASTTSAFERVNALLPILTTEVTADRARRSKDRRSGVRSPTAGQVLVTEASTRGTGAPARSPRSEVAAQADFAVWSRLVRRDAFEDDTSSLDVADIKVPQAAPDLRTLAVRLEPGVKAAIAAATATISNDAVRTAFEAWMIRVHSGPSPDA